MKIKTFLINLKESEKRRKRALKELSRYPFMEIELVEAVDGKKLTAEEADNLFDRERFTSKYNHEPLPGEIGCTLSHLECYRRLLQSDNEFALILEDDVEFLDPENVESIFKTVVDLFLSKRAYLVTFTRHLIYYTRKQLVIGEYILYRLWSAEGTCAYLINRKGAQEILSFGKPFIVADDFEYMIRQGVFIQGIYPPLALDHSCAEIVKSEIDRSNLIYIQKRRTFFCFCMEYLRIKYQAVLFKLGILAERTIKYGRNI